MSKYLEVEWDIIGNGEEHHGMNAACPEDYGSRPCLREMSSYCEEVGGLPYLEQPGREDRRPCRNSLVKAGNDKEDATNGDQGNSLGV